MPDLDPADIERLLQEGARRRGVTVEAYRDFVQAAADRAGVSFATALQVISLLDKMPSGFHPGSSSTRRTRQRTVPEFHLAIARSSLRNSFSMIHAARTRVHTPLAGGMKGRNRCRATPLYERSATRARR